MYSTGLRVLSRRLFNNNFPVKCRYLSVNNYSNSSSIISNSGTFYQSKIFGALNCGHPILHQNWNHLLLSQPRCQFHVSGYFNSEKDEGGDKKPEKVSIGKRFKQMFKDYWYVLVPVHVVTSVVWYGGFYLMCKSGIDMVGVLQSLGTSEAYLEKLSNSNAGYYALAYACYKIATPARYTVTVGGTTLSIKYLNDWGYLKKSSEIADNVREKSNEIVKDMEDKRQELKDKYEDKKDEGRKKWEDGRKKWEDYLKRREERLKSLKKK